MGRIQTLAINEIFGPTFQGEGPHVGKRCGFVRLAGCNLACSWCDTPYSWDWKRYDVRQESVPMSVSEVAERVFEMGVQHVVITGGEPMLQQRALIGLSALLRNAGIFIEMETAGSVLPVSMGVADHYNVSPKLESSGNARSKRYNPGALEALNEAPSVAFKFVITDEQDFGEVDELVQLHGLAPVYIMPEGISNDTINSRLKQLASAALERGYNITTRMHVQLYGSTRGV